MLKGSQNFMKSKIYSIMVAKDLYYLQCRCTYDMIFFNVKLRSVK